MRLLDLRLEKYGPFENKILQFEPQARLHIVYGANEAGKSSALAAIGDLFYGAPRAAIGFLRPRDLRLGATILGRNGQTLQFFRRRGDKNNLLDAAGAALPDDALAPFLGAAARDVFQRAFGLDAQRLREGGNEMLRADGEIGASLFAAASGLRGLVDLRKRLETDAEKIFDKTRAGHRSFYQALDRFNDAHKREKAATLADSTLKRLAGDIAAARERIAALSVTQKELQGEKRRLDMLGKAAPILRRLALDTDILANFDDLAAFAPEWAQQLAKALDVAQALAEQAALRRAACEAAQAEIDEARIDAPLLAQGEVIEDLIRASGAYEKSADDLPRREVALRDKRQALRLHAQNCGFAEAAELRAAQPDAATLNQAEKLLTLGRSLLVRKAEPERALLEEQSRHAVLLARQGPKPLGDAADLREKLAALGPVASWDASWREAEQTCAQDSRELAEKALRLSPPLANLELFAQRPSPNAAAIAETAQAFDELAGRRREAENLARQSRAALDEAATELCRLERQGAVPSPEALQARRQNRDGDWRILRAALLGEAPAEPGSPSIRQKVSLFESGLTETDRLADALIADSARVAEAQAARDKMALAQRKLELAEAELKLLARQVAQAQQDWTEEWRDCGLSPTEPRKMLAWRGQADLLLDAREALARKQAKARDWQALLAQAGLGLEALASACGLEPLAGVDSARLARRIEAKIAEIAKAQDKARAEEAEIADAPRRIGELQARLADLAQEEAQWREGWHRAVDALRLDANVSFDEAQKRIALWRSLPNLWDDERELSERVQKIAEDIAHFEARLDAALALCARDIPARPASHAIAALRDRLSRTREQAAVQGAARDRLLLAETAAGEIQLKLAEAERGLAPFAEAARAQGQDDIANLRQRLGGRDELAAQIAAERKSLTLIGDGVDAASFAAEAKTFEASANVARLREIDRQLESDDLLVREVYAEQRARETELLKLQTGTGAEGAIQSRENAKAEMAEEARRWAVLKLASLLVGAGLERHRADRQDPLLARAGALLATLTCHKYAGLEQAFGEDDQLRLNARRVDGASLEVQALSEGARDQLYLALRLAFLEDYAARADTPPFIGDDLFASFDNSRVVAGLEALAQAGATIQPILFTHHAHIVALAQGSLGSQAQILSLD